MSAEDAKLLTAIQVSLARIESSVDNTLHRVRNMEQANLLFITRRESEQAIEVLAERLQKIESRAEWFYRWLWAAWIAGLFSTVGLGRKAGLF